LLRFDKLSATKQGRPILLKGVRFDKLSATKQGHPELVEG